MAISIHQAELLKELSINRSTRKKRPRKFLAIMLTCAGMAITITALSVGVGSSEVTDTDHPIGRTQPESSIRTPEQQSETVAGPHPSAQESVLDATGYVVARRSATVSAKTTGKVVEVLIEEGMEVSAGQVIARLDDAIERSQLALAEAQIDAARALTAELDADITRAERALHRWGKLAASRLTSESRLDDLRADLDSVLARQIRARKDTEVAVKRAAVHRVSLADFLIKAPFDGVVVSKSAQPGEMISPISAGGGFTRTGIGTIVDMHSLEVEVDVNEAYINRVYRDQRVRVQLNAYPATTYQGYVLAVIPSADRSKATIRVRVGFVETDHRVLPQMGVRVAFIDAQRVHAQRINS